MIIQNKKNELEQQKQQLLHNLQKGKDQSTYQIDSKSNIPTIPTVTPTAAPTASTLTATAHSPGRGPTSPSPPPTTAGILSTSGRETITPGGILTPCPR